MYRQVDRRKCRCEDAALHKDTTAQWDLVAAAVEEANIICHGPSVDEATKMRGRPNTTFKKCVRHLLEGLGQDEESSEHVDRLTNPRKAAGEHLAFGNKLINVARRMKVNARHKGNQ